jgi:pyruvate/2-oxoglutarate dehydrogenase complex dihydrolipoamide dehydrogenase (E3) component
VVIGAGPAGFVAAMGAAGLGADRARGRGEQIEGGHTGSGRNGGDGPVAGAHAPEVDEILVTAGRAPNVEDLALEAAGVALDPRDPWCLLPAPGAHRRVHMSSKTGH